MSLADNSDPLVHDDSILSIVAEHLGEFIHKDFDDGGPCSECRWEAQFLMHKIAANVRAQIAREVQAAKPRDLPRTYYSTIHQAWDQAAEVVRDGFNDGRS